jgi:hypothetical protein
MFIILIKCCKYFVLCLLYITDTTPWQTICIRTTLKYNRSLEKHVLAHFQQTCSQIYFRLVLTYYVNHSLKGAPHLFVILTVIGWFIVNIQSDLFWHRCLERQTFGTPRMYTLSPSKSIKGSNYGEFLNVLLCTWLYKYAPNLESLLTQPSVSSDSIVKGIIDDIIKTAVKSWRSKNKIFTTFY